VKSKPLEEQWMEDPNFDFKGAEDGIDRELAEMMQRNQARLIELNRDFKQVSKVMDEPYVNVRKMKQPAAIAIKQQIQKNLASVDSTVDENVDAV